MKKHVLAAASLLALLLASASSCASEVSSGTVSPDTDGTNGTVSSAIVTESTEPSRENTPDSLPDGLDYEGRTFTIHYYELNEEEWVAEKENGEVINDAIYRRNLAVSERLNTELSMFYGGSLADYNSRVTSNLRISISAGEGAYDLIAGYCAYITRGMDGYLLDLHTVPHLDFDQPWWIADMTEELTIHDKLFYATGDIGMSVLQNMDVLFFDTTLAADYDIEIYPDVFAGNWTLDKMTEAVRTVSSDLDNDGVINENDRVGLMMFDKASGFDAFLGAFRQHVTEKDANGEPALCINTPRVIQIVDDLYHLFYEGQGALVPKQNYPASMELAVSRFTAGECLFFLERLLCAENGYLRDMKNDWGVVPIPKLDDAQEEYGVYLCDSHSMFCIPIDCKDAEFAGAVTEALAAESYRHLTDAYYIAALQDKYSRDSETVKVLDMLKPLAVSDFGYVYNTIGAPYFLRETVRKGNKNLASWYKSQEKIILKALNTAIEAYRD